MPNQEALVAHADLVMDFLGHLRMMHLWFHGAHHLVSGVSFSGDHANLFGTIYTEIQEQMDGAIEKFVGLIGEDMGDPLAITSKALGAMQTYQSPAHRSATAIAMTGLQIEKDFLGLCEEMYAVLKQNDALTLGLDDFIMATASAHETFVYLLQQRVREAMQQQAQTQGMAPQPAMPAMQGPR
jgi:DNA-binding ferritin-like protein